LPNIDDGPNDYPGEFYSDEAITTPQQDRLGRERFVKILSNRLIFMPLQDSFVFGLYGAWGEGKTSVLNLVEEELKQKNNVVVVRYDPWYYDSADALLSSFYERLDSALNDIYFLPNLKRILFKYQEVIKAGLKPFGLFTDFSFANESLLDMKMRVSELLVSTRKRFVVFVDDIDRMSAKEILSVLKLVKLQADFKNLIFVIALDPNIVNSILSGEQGFDSTYLSKVIQEPVQLPAIDQEQLDGFLYSELSLLLMNMGASTKRVKAFLDEFKITYEKCARPLFATFREVKRFLNGLYTSLPSVISEVNYNDFLVLEMIRVFYQEVYRDIAQNPWFYMPPWSYFQTTLSPFNIGTPVKSRQMRIKDNVESLKKRHEHKDVLERLLRNIFPEVDNAYLEKEESLDSRELRRRQKITHPDSFQKYFLMQVPAYDIPDEKIQDLISTWNSDSNKTVKNIIKEDILKFTKEHKLTILLDKLRVFDTILNVKIVELLISVLGENSAAYSMDSWRKGHSDFSEVRSTIVRLISERIDPSKQEWELINLIRKTDPIMASEIYVEITKTQAMKNLKDQININNLTSKLSDKLTKHCQKRDVYKINRETASFLIRTWGSLSENDKDAASKYFFKLVDKNQRYLGYMLSDVVVNLALPQMDYAALGLALDIKELRKKVFSAGKKAYGNDEEKTAIDIFLDLSK
jgi:hypothetical protein